MALAAIAAACPLAAAATAAPSARSDAPAANAKAAPTVPFQLTDDSTGVSAFATASRQRREQGGSAAAPEELHLVFDADAHHFDYRLHRIPPVFAAGAGVTVEGVRHAITEEETPLRCSTAQRSKPSLPKRATHSAPPISQWAQRPGR